MSTQQPPSQPTPAASDQGPTAPQAAPSLGELVARISQSVTALVKGEIDLAKAKGRRMLSKIGLGVGLLAAAAVLALYGLGMALVGIAHGLSVLMPSWVAYLIVAVTLFIVVAVLALLGAKKVKAGLDDVPDPQARLRQDVDAVKDAVRTGLERGSLK